MIREYYNEDGITMAPSTRAKRGKMALARERKIEKIQSWVEWLSERKEN